jgi:hypothetical protein
MVLLLPPTMDQLLLTLQNTQGICSQHLLLMGTLLAATHAKDCPSLHCCIASK